MRPRLMTTYAPPDGEIPVVHADDAIVLVDKPSGLLSVPGKPEAHWDCVAHRVREAFPGTRLIHRLDLETSGIMVFARTHAAQRHINLQFERRVVKKRYVARVWGRPEADAGTIDLPMIVDWPNRPLQKICFETGKPARTGWSVAVEEGLATRIDLAPETGRSHQLRVHMKALGHPILGDPFYAPDEAFAAADRLQLHAVSLRLRHPDDGRWVSFEAPCPF